MTCRKRGRPRKAAFFKDATAPVKKRPITILAKHLKEGERQFTQSIRAELGCKSYVSLEVIWDVLREQDGLDPIALQQAYERMEATKRLPHDGGRARSRKQQVRKASILSEYQTVFDRVRKGGMTKNSAAMYIRRQMESSEADCWVPSVRLLNGWLRAYCNEQSLQVP